MPVFFLSLFFVLVQSCHAVFCPYCGVSNKAEYNFCYECGKSLKELNTKNQAPPSEPRPSSESISAPPQNSQPPLTQTFGKGRIFSELSRPDGKTAPATAREDFYQKMQSFLGQGSALQLQGLNGSNISADKLQELNQNPEVVGLVEQMKNPEFQSSILEGLRQFQSPDNPQANQQLQQLEMLFRLLNQNSSTPFLAP